MTSYSMTIDRYWRDALEATLQRVLSGVDKYRYPFPYKRLRLDVQRYHRAEYVADIIKVRIRLKMVDDINADSYYEFTAGDNNSYEEMKKKAEAWLILVANVDRKKRMKILEDEA